MLDHPALHLPELRQRHGTGQLEIDRHAVSQFGLVAFAVAVPRFQQENCRRDVAILGLFEQRVVQHFVLHFAALVESLLQLGEPLAPDFERLIRDAKHARNTLDA